MTQCVTAQQRLFWGLNQALSEAGWHGVFLIPSASGQHGMENGTCEAVRLHYALDHGFAGIILSPSPSRDNRKRLQEVTRRIPLVLIDRQVPGVEADFVGVNHFVAMQEATCHLKMQGHSRIGLITPADTIAAFQDHIMAYRAALRSADLPALDQVIMVGSQQEWAMFDRLFRLPKQERPSALLCVSDSIAHQVLERLAALGIRVPNELTLISFGGSVQPPSNGACLANIALPFEDIGATAARLFMKRIKTPDCAPQSVEIVAPLVTKADDKGTCIYFNRMGADERTLHWTPTAHALAQEQPPIGSGARSVLA